MDENGIAWYRVLPPLDEFVADCIVSRSYSLRGSLSFSWPYSLRCVGVGDDCGGGPRSSTLIAGCCDLSPRRRRRTITTTTTTSSSTTTKAAAPPIAANSQLGDDDASTGARVAGDGGDVDVRFNGSAIVVVAVTVVGLFVVVVVVYALLRPQLGSQTQLPPFCAQFCDDRMSKQLPLPSDGSPRSNQQAPESSIRTCGKLPFKRLLFTYR